MRLFVLSLRCWLDVHNKSICRETCIPWFGHSKNMQVCMFNVDGRPVGQRAKMGILRRNLLVQMGSGSTEV